MITKAEMVEAISNLPDDATIRDAIERLQFIELIEQRVADAEAGNIVTHDEARRRFAAWLE